jgi:hypothetical protein
MSVCLGWNASKKGERKDACTGQTAAKTALHHMRETGMKRIILFKKSFSRHLSGAREAGFSLVFTTRPAFGLGSGLAGDY